MEQESAGKPRGRLAVVWDGSCSSDDHRWLSEDGIVPAVRDEKCYQNLKMYIKYNKANLMVGDIYGLVKIYPDDFLGARRSCQRSDVAEIVNRIL